MEKTDKIRSKGTKMGADPQPTSTHEKIFQIEKP